MIKLCILSKGRPEFFEKKTYKILKNHNLLHISNLFLSKEDIENYKYFKIPIIETPDGYTNACNFITSYYPENTIIILMGDDLIEFYFYNGEKNIKLKSLGDLIKNMIWKMITLNINLCGLYPNNNPLFIRGAKEEITTDLRFIHDVFCIFINKKDIKLDEKISKTDFQRTIEYFKRDGKILRFNKYSFDTKFNVGKKGNEIDKNNEKYYSKLFYDKYKDYIKRVIIHKSGTSSFVLRPTGILRDK